MNKRLIKKMKKKHMPIRGYMYSQGNNGGDYIEIENFPDGRLYLKSGSSCVVTINAVVPVEFLTKIIEDKMLEYNFDIKAIIDSFNWSKEFKEELKAKVRG